MEVSDNENNKNTNIDDLIKYIQYNNFEIETTKKESTINYKPIK